MAVSVLTSVSNDTQTGRFQAVMTVDGTAAASSVFCGFVPRRVTVQQIGGTPDAKWRSEWVTGMTAAHLVLTGNTGAGTIGTANGITVLAGTEAAPSAAMTGSPASSGAGFTVGTACIANSLVYVVNAER